MNQQNSNNNSSFDNTHNYSHDNTTKHSSISFINNKVSDEDVNKLIQATIKIQRVWRRYIDLQVSRYYKDLVIFHNEGDPALIMKYINPNEAKLIDSASGIHIKFRLAGTQFPPTIYYKIFTHRPVQDICANAPRDYTKPYLKLKAAQVKNNRLDKSFPIESTEGWYQRIENNGWRPVSNKHLHQMNLDFYYGFNYKQKESKSTQVFSHSKMLRKKDIEAKKKRNKIEWMKKMYQNGMLKTNDKESALIVSETAEQIINAYDNDKIDQIDDWEVDQLIDWTNGLSYSEYVDSWKAIGTTAGSDKLVNERIKHKNNSQFSRENTFDTIPDSIEFTPKVKTTTFGSSTPLQ